MDALRTPDEYFEGLSGYPYPAEYFELSDHGGLRMHYAAAGPASGREVLLLHGEPTWSYMYRTAIPVLAEAGCRAIAPDLIGFGRSDKPPERSDYSYEAHFSWLEAFVLGLDLKDAVLICHDWGGLLGLRLVAKHPDRFVGVVATNTFLPTGEGTMPAMFKTWCDFSQTVPEFPVGDIVQRGTMRELSENILAGYDAPFPDESYKAAARQFPILVPQTFDSSDAAANREAWKVLETYDKPFVCAFSDQDPITRGLDKILIERIPGAKDANHVTLKGVGHFSPEERGPELAYAALEIAEDL